MLAGAGIAGLALAMALHKKGVSFTIYEEARQYSVVGWVSIFFFLPNFPLPLAGHHVNAFDDMAVLALVSPQMVFARWTSLSLTFEQSMKKSALETSLLMLSGFFSKVNSSRKVLVCLDRSIRSHT